MTVRIGVDGGQSTLRLGIAGRPERTEAPGFSYDDADPYAASVAAVTEAWRRTGVREPVGTVVLGLSGAPSDPARRRERARAVAAALGAARAWVAGDMVTAHAGALPDGHGVVLAAGTGTVCLGIDAGTGAARRVDGWGHLFGDGGSAFATGRAGVAAALEAADGRGSATVLTEVLARLGPIDQAPERFYTSPTRVSDVARFALDVAAAAEGGDAVADRIVRDAARALVRTVRSAASVIHTGHVPLVLSGRWLTTSPIRSAFETALADLPRVRLVPAAGDGVDGACRLATASDLGPYAAFFHDS
ncbi:MAG TPA: BadF/BadG/BcrA/BcrD ATPase family protein [Mycobacteriales bacterium]|nr:BadF/BadG/BcrA/BcrD ATPase family protein [Mycobacteriales bacterium]